MFSELTCRKTRLTKSVTGFPDKKNLAVSDQHSADSLCGGTIEASHVFGKLEKKNANLEKKNANIVLHTKAVN
jgi:hypothetical protein